MTTTEKKVKKRKLQGVVVSDKMDKTVVVTVTHFRVHKKYRKQYTIQRRFKAHDAKNEYKTGDKVVIEETRPYSKEKHWEVTKLLERKEEIKEQDEE